MLYEFFKRVLRFVSNKYQTARLSFLSYVKPIKIIKKGKLRINQKVVLEGYGEICFSGSIMLGVSPSPYLNESSIYLESRSVNSKITIGNDVFINNNAVLIADQSSISIGDSTMIGSNFTCFDSNFHSLIPHERLNHGNYTCKPVIIGRNVFIGSNVTILRGSRIGDNTTIGAGCVISGEIPENSIVSVSQNIKVSSIRES
jgi:maltose O-acetyltransferase